MYLFFTNLTHYQGKILKRIDKFITIWMSSWPVYQEMRPGMRARTHPLLYIALNLHFESCALLNSWFVILGKIQFVLKWEHWYNVLHWIPFKLFRLFSKTTLQGAMLFTFVSIDRLTKQGNDVGTIRNKRRLHESIYRFPLCTLNTSHTRKGTPKQSSF